MESTASVLYAAVTTASGVQGAVPKDANELRHHLKDGKGFRNPWDSWQEMSGWRIGAAMAWRVITGTRNKPDTTPPTVTVRRPSFLQSRKTPSLRATWLGHACYYVEFPGGFRVLFDPVFTERCSPFSWLGPKRYTPMPCQIEDIPIVDAIVISHNHYDHLSHPTILKLKERHPHAHFFAPLGNKQWFTKCGITNMTELDWWQSSNMTLSPDRAEKKVVREDSSSQGSSAKSSPQRKATNEISATIGCLPCQHTSARTGFDKSRTLWASWSISSGGKKVWFGGDTGYRAVPELPATEDDYSAAHAHLPHCPAFAQIGDLRGPFDLGLIPIGAYDPRWIMSSMHANPRDAVNIFVDTRCRRAMGIHWGTWVLTEEDVLEPPRLLREALRWRGLPEEGVFEGTGGLLPLCLAVMKADGHYDISRCVWGGVWRVEVLDLTAATGLVTKDYVPVIEEEYGKAYVVDVWSETSYALDSCGTTEALSDVQQALIRYTPPSEVARPDTTATGHGRSLLCDEEELSDEFKARRGDSARVLNQSQGPALLFSIHL